MRQYGFAAAGGLRAGRTQAGAASRLAASAALKRPQGMAGSSLLRAVGRRLKATATEFRAVPNAAEVRRPAGCLGAALTAPAFGRSRVAPQRLTPAAPP